MQAAISADAHNPLARYEKAQVLQSTDEDAAALKELELLKAMLPLEASVLFQVRLQFLGLRVGTDPLLAHAWGVCRWGRSARSLRTLSKRLFTSTWP